MIPNHKSNNPFLEKLRSIAKKPVSAGSNRPIPLNNQQNMWVVNQGWLDIFVVPVKQGRPAGVRQHLFRVKEGEAIFGVALDPNICGLMIVAVGGPDTELLPLTRPAFEQMARNLATLSNLTDLVTPWILGFSTSIGGDVPLKEAKILTPNHETTLAQHKLARPYRGIIWIKQRQGTVQFLGKQDLSLKDGNFFPLSNVTWVQSADQAKLGTVDSETLIKQGLLWPALDDFHRVALACVKQNLVQAAQIDQQRLQDKLETDELAVNNAFSNLASILESASTLPLTTMDERHPHPLVAACNLVGHALGLKIQPPFDIENSPTRDDALRRIARASQLRYRRVALRGAWWHADNGPLLAFTTPPSTQTGQPSTEPQPVALCPTSSNRYEILNPITETRSAVTAEVAASLEPFAYMFYRPLPAQALGIWDLLKLGFWGSKRDFLLLLLMGIGIGLLALVPPLATGVLFEVIIPGAESSQLVQLGLALLVSAVAAAMFLLVRNMAILRLEGRFDAFVQAAVWDRLLRLPVPFFRQFSAGDLAHRAMGVSIMRRVLSETTINAILGGIFSIFTFGLLFFIDASLAWIATGLILIFMAATFIAGYIQVRHQRELTDVQGRVAGLVLQLISGITKLRMAGVETRAFAVWAKPFAQQRQITFATQAVSNNLTVFNAAYPLLALTVIFAAVVYLSQNETALSTGAFLAFNTAFLELLFAGLLMSSALVSMLKTVPVYERTKPILQTIPEVDPAKAHPGRLKGEIEISHVVFRYHEDEPLVLNNISFRIKPGEFVTVVGRSGCGKSTLLRLLLGFETPLSGAIYYDRQDLAALDVEAVREQLGVVLQDSKLITGDIFTNIVGSAPLSLDDAWQAARRVGLEDEIKQMPMEMHTIVSEGGSTLSGGQRQRLLIARAIVNRPRILFFDEATSSLDNRTQALVNQSLERLQVTRVVIAHRLSTIIRADRIYVMDKGELVERGTYAQLLHQKGLYSELVKRQQI